MPDWGLEDMRAWIATTFFAGTDTTTHAIENALYLLMTVPGLQEELRAGDAETVERFAEEVLRLYPSVHFMRRRANEDFELAGRRIKRDDALLMLDAGANRDPARFTAPHDIDLAATAGASISLSASGRVPAPAPRSPGRRCRSRWRRRSSGCRISGSTPMRSRRGSQGFLLRSYQPLHALFDLV